MGSLPHEAKVVVIGGGIAGCSTAYHLANNGWNTVLIERDVLTSGTTWHAAGMITQLGTCLLYTSPSPRDRTRSRMPSSA